MLCFPVRSFPVTAHVTLRSSLPSWGTIHTPVRYHFFLCRTRLGQACLRSPMRCRAVFHDITRSQTRTRMPSQSTPGVVAAAAAECNVDAVTSATRGSAAEPFLTHASSSCIHVVEMEGIATTATNVNCCDAGKLIKCSLPSRLALLFKAVHMQAAPLTVRALRSSWPRGGA